MSWHVDPRGIRACQQCGGLQGIPPQDCQHPERISISSCAQTPQNLTFELDWAPPGYCNLGPSVLAAEPWSSSRDIDPPGLWAQALFLLSPSSPSSIYLSAMSTRPQSKDDNNVADPEKHEGSHTIEDTATAGHVATDEHGNPLLATDADAEARLRRKIDWAIVPPVALLYVSLASLRWLTRLALYPDLSADFLDR